MGCKGFTDCRSSDQGRRAEKVVGLVKFIHYFTDLGLQTTHFRFIYARMCIFASKCVYLRQNVYI